MTNELYLVTNQALSMFDIFALDGSLYQVTGHAGDGYLCDAIDWDDESAAAAIDLDIDAINRMVSDLAD